MELFFEAYILCTVNCKISGIGFSDIVRIGQHQLQTQVRCRGIGSFERRDIEGISWRHIALVPDEIRVIAGSAAVERD